LKSGYESLLREGSEGRGRAHGCFERGFQSLAAVHGLIQLGRIEGEVCGGGRGYSTLGGKEALGKVERLEYFGPFVLVERHDIRNRDAGGKREGDNSSGGCAGKKIHVFEN